MKSYRQFITESVTLRVNILRRPIVFTKPPRARNDELVQVKVPLFDAAFKLAPDTYIGHGGVGQIKNRYQRFGVFFNGGVDPDLHIEVEPTDTIEASEVVVTDTGRVEFINGRHRYAWLRDHGVKNLPVCMDKESVANAKKFGYI